MVGIAKRTWVDAQGMVQFGEPRYTACHAHFIDRVTQDDWLSFKVQDALLDELVRNENQAIGDCGLPPFTKLHFLDAANRYMRQRNHHVPLYYDTVCNDRLSPTPDYTWQRIDAMHAAQSELLHHAEILVATRYLADLVFEEAYDYMNRHKGASDMYRGVLKAVDRIADICPMVSKSEWLEQAIEIEKIARQVIQLNQNHAHNTGDRSARYL